MRYCIGNRFGGVLATLIWSSGWSSETRELTLRAREALFLLHRSRCIKHFLSKDRMQQAMLDQMQQMQRFFMTVVGGALHPQRKSDESGDNLLEGLVFSQPPRPRGHPSPSHVDALRSRCAALPPIQGPDASQRPDAPRVELPPILAERPSPEASGLLPPPRDGGALSPDAPRLSPPLRLDGAITPAANAASNQQKFSQSVADALAMVANKAKAKSRAKVAVAVDDSSSDDESGGGGEGRDGDGKGNDGVDLPLVEELGDARKGSTEKQIKNTKRNVNEGHRNGEVSDGKGGQGTKGHKNGVGEGETAKAKDTGNGAGGGGRKRKKKDAGKKATEKAKAETASGDHVTVGTATKAKAGKASGDHATDAPKTGGKKAILDWPRLFDN